MSSLVNVVMKEVTIIFLRGHATWDGLKEAKARFFHRKLCRYNHIDYHVIDFNPTTTGFHYHTTKGILKD